MVRSYDLEAVIIICLIEFKSTPPCSTTTSACGASFVLDMAAEDGRASRMELSAGAPSDFFCPISHEMMVRPVVCSDGHSYERAKIARWLQQDNTSPRTGLTLPNLMLTPNITLRNAIEGWREKTFRLIRPADLTKGEQIGRGTFNRVYAATLVVRREGAPPRTIDVAASIRPRRHCCN